MNWLEIITFNKCLYFVNNIWFVIRTCRFLNNQDEFKEYAKKDVEESHKYVANFGGDDNENHEIRSV